MYHTVFIIVFSSGKFVLNVQKDYNPTSPGCGRDLMWLAGGAKQSQNDCARDPLNGYLPRGHPAESRASQSVQVDISRHSRLKKSKRRSGSPQRFGASGARRAEIHSATPLSDIQLSDIQFSRLIWFSCDMGIAASRRGE